MTLKCPTCAAPEDKLCDFDCDTCAGSGECDDCMGEGDPDCPTCEGCGSCVECDGNGFIEGEMECMECGHVAGSYEFDEDYQ